MPIRPEVRLIQSGLKYLGFNPGTIDGWWGPRTKDAALRLLAAGTTRRGQAVKEIQQGVSDLGWSAGAIDGIWGPKTAAAVRQLVDVAGAPRASVVSISNDIQAPAGGLVPKPSVGVIYQGSARHVVRSFMLHTTATSSTWWKGKTNKRMFDEVKSWHITPVAKGGNGWRDIGYHGLVFPDGERMIGRPETEIGAGAVGYNAGWIHWSMVPVVTITRIGRPDDFYTPETIASMREVIADVGRRTPLSRLAGHNEVAAKLCPGFHVIDAEWTDLNVT